MNLDPYKVLGVSPNATDDEIKQAYRKLAKKYHPDLHPGDKEAERRMNEVNAAYDQIKNPQQSNYGFGGSRTSGSYSSQGGSGYGGYGGFGGFGGFSGTRSSYTSEDRTEIRAAINFIQTRHFREAVNALEGVPQAERNARWYYVSAIANYGIGNKIKAVEHAERAVQMDPSNPEYRSLLNELQNGGSYYQTYTSGMPNMKINPNSCLWCCTASLLCNFCRC